MATRLDADCAGRWKPATRESHAAGMRRHILPALGDRRSPAWKPSTVKATLSYLDCAILPALGHLRVGSVRRADIARFFRGYGRRKPGGTNRSHDVLRTLFDCAIAWGHRAEAAGNPCKGVVRYRRPPRGRLLGAAARELLDGLAASASGAWVFPGRGDDEPLDRNDLWTFWTGARREAGVVADARLHDLRRAHASHAVMNGESLHVAGRLLGHRRASTTSRYVHLDDATLGEAAEWVAVAVWRKLRRSPPRRDRVPMPPGCGRAPDLCRDPAFCVDPMDMLPNHTVH